MIIEERISNYLIGWRELGIAPTDIIDPFAHTHPRVPVRDLILPQVDEALELYERDPAKALEAWHEDGEDKKVVSFLDKQIELKTWHSTNVNLGAPLEIDFNGNKVAIRSFGVSWSTDEN